MRKKPLTSPEFLRKILRYDPDTGKLFWLERSPDLFERAGNATQSASAARWNARFSGKEAMNAVKKTTLYGRIMGQKILTHRAIWAFQTGEWPDGIIDHINGNPFDNRWSNLRLATLAQNSWNRGISTQNKSGYKGVSQRVSAGLWYARISVTMGPFETAREAAEAYNAASEFHHGDFARSRK